MPKAKSDRLLWVADFIPPTAKGNCTAETRGTSPGKFNFLRKPSKKIIQFSYLVKAQYHIEVP